MTDCKYQMHLPSVGTCCKAYLMSIREDGKDWMHFPACDDANCPLKHPELLEGAKLERKENNK